MDQQMKNFIGLSAVLTGFASGTIAPNIDPINIKADYYTKFQAEIGNDLFFQILSDFENQTKNDADPLNLSPERSQQVGEAMLANSKATDYLMACRQLIFLWYSGAWATVVPASDCEPESVASTLLSSKSYTQGLAWQVMQSHPMGDSNYRYGYWANEPAPLSGYTGNTND